MLFVYWNLTGRAEEMQQESQGKRPSAQKRVAGKYSLVYFQTCCNVMNKLHLSIMSRYKTFHRNQYTNIFLGHFLNIEENNSWTIQCHSYEIFQVNALIGVLPFSDWPRMRIHASNVDFSHLLGNWWKGDLLLK